MSKFEKEKQKLLQEKCQTVLNDMLRDEDNKYCVDCDAKGPRWASWNLGIFLCIRCAGIHRNLGVHISRVKSVNLDSWTPEQVVTMQQMGNSRARAIYEANMPDGLRRPQTDSTLESFIRAKYEHKKYIAKEWVQSPPVKVNWDTEIEESMRKAKEAKKSGTGSSDIGPIPTPVSKPQKTSPAPVAKAAVIDVGKVVGNHGLITTQSGPPPPIISNSASHDLLGLTVSTPTNLFSTQQELNNGADFSTNTNNTKDDLGSIFESDASPSIDLGKMSKESILKLYGSAPSTPVNPFVQAGGGGSPFGNINLQSGVTTGGPNPPFAQMGYAYPSNSNIMGQPQHSQQQQPTNTFSGLNQLGMSGYGGAPSHQNDMTQVQNQLFGLNLGNQSSTSSHLKMTSGVAPNNTTGNFGSLHPHPPQIFSQIPTNLMGPQMNSFMSTPNPTYQTTKADNLPGLGNSVSQLMQPRLSDANFWK